MMSNVNADLNKIVIQLRTEPVWFGLLCFNGISTFVSYLMPKPSFQKNSSDII